MLTTMRKALRRESGGAPDAAIPPSARSLDPARSPSDKNLPLEAIRGLAAISVVLWHAMLAFFPAWSGHFREYPHTSSIAGQAWFGLIHGRAAVTLFFVLSGYVLTRRYFETLDDRIILRGALKRWPRLVGPVMITTLLSYALFALTAYHDEEAAVLTGSPWLVDFAFAPTSQFVPSFVEALQQGLFGVFFLGQSTYDSSLWTMRYEFGGSFIAFALALGLGRFRQTSRPVALAAFAMVAIFVNLNAGNYSPFVASVGLAYFLPRPGETKPWPPALVYSAAIASVYLLGYSGKCVGAFAWAPASEDWISGFHVGASLLLIAALEQGPSSIRRALSGRVSAMLGALSFPLYLVHVLVLCSAGCALFLAAREADLGDFTARLVGAGATVTLSVVVALPLVAFNELWVKVVNFAVAKAMAWRPEGAPAPTIAPIRPSAL